MRILIVDDEKPACSKIRHFLKRLQPAAEIMEAGDGATAIKAITSQSPDLIFLDIQMPGLTGFDVIREVGPDQMPPVVFVTAFDRYAVQAFEVQAVDYLLKPFDFERLKTAFEKALCTHHRPAQFQQTLTRLLQRLDARPDYLRRLPIKSDERIFFVNPDEIQWIEAQGKYANIHTTKTSHMMRTSLQDLEIQLNPRQFYRIHRSHMINVDFIRELQTWFHGDYNVVLKNGTKLRLSRRYSARLLARL